MTETVHRAKKSDLQVVSICTSVGFPVGLATSQTISYIASALKEQGAATSVLHCGPHPYSVNEPRYGDFGGTCFRYLGITTRRPKSTLFRNICYATAYGELACRLFCLRL